MVIRAVMVGHEGIVQMTRAVPIIDKIVTAKITIAQAAVANVQKVVSHKIDRFLGKETKLSQK